MHRQVVCFLVGWFLFSIIADNCLADPGNPVAIRHLPTGGYSIETMWDFAIVLGTTEHDLKDREGVDIIWTQSPPSGSPANRILVDLNSDRETHHVLDRHANEARSSWRSVRDSESQSTNAVEITSTNRATVTVAVDGVRISLVVLPAEGRSLSELIESSAATSHVILVHSETSPATVVSEIDSLDDKFQHTFVVGLPESSKHNNTLAVNQRLLENSSDRQVVHLSSIPTVLAPELEQLMQKMEAANQASQQVFGKLSLEQLNFRPSNGSHTPRWNAEHMMGRELLFFSQIYANQEKAIPVMNLNPEQMPPDYKARHSDWTGREEARQMQRVSSFSRRFAYLLRGLPLDSRAPGSGWTPRRLLQQMDHHYTEHTANVKKKFELPDWPKE